VFDLIVLKQLLHEEYYSSDEKDDLQAKTKTFVGKFNFLVQIELTWDTRTITVSSRNAINSITVLAVYCQGKYFFNSLFVSLNSQAIEDELAIFDHECSHAP
jgi:hypothetical protein